ncbi:Predicted thiol-disulfide oxidoreductase YuxK, DCC family [Paenibacillus uliginis N3/975]|uniref:Predicted thiol-disulfide oxidoreductase YuxK, DCC family n=2 Tax=Paenibacillus TaxID=44249 RepID=A0A1X7GRT6_9BACL|nr:Predicted thiol-disulfide oxidoreductase YuxK, DCC family [Paenibacillus uliginis N3/975]
MDKHLEQSQHTIVLIDGVCHMCQGLTKFIIKRDPAGVFQFASLQSDIGKDILRQGGLPEETVDTVVVVENGTYYTRSAAALRIVRRLTFPWRLLYGFIIVPRALRDVLYKWVAKNRYRWFGQDEECMIPTPEIRRRFL